MSANINTSKYIDLFDTHIKRSGSDKLREYILKSSFFTAPASSKYHGAYNGGLCAHSLNVYNEMLRLRNAFQEININDESLAICSLLHDVCKIGCYKTEMRNKKENGVWIQVPFYVFEECFPFGSHGGKSVWIIERFMRLTEEEAVAINCHMGNEDGKYSVSAAYEKYPLAWLLHVADESATFITESQYKGEPVYGENQ